MNNFRFRHDRLGSINTLSMLQYPFSKDVRLSFKLSQSFFDLSYHFLILYQLPNPVLSGQDPAYDYSLQLKIYSVV